SCIFDRHTHQRIVIDWRDSRPGDKQYHWEQHGVPLRIEVGPRDVDSGAFVLKQRLDRAKATIPLPEATAAWLTGRLEDVHYAISLPHPFWWPDHKNYHRLGLRRAASGISGGCLSRGTPWNAYSSALTSGMCRHNIFRLEMHEGTGRDHRLARDAGYFYSRL